MTQLMKSRTLDSFSSAGLTALFVVDRTAVIEPGTKHRWSSCYWSLSGQYDGRSPGPAADVQSTYIHSQQ